MQMCCIMFSTLFEPLQKILTLVIIFYLFIMKIRLRSLLRSIYSQYICNYENNFIVNGPMVVVLIFSACMYFYGADIQDFFIPYLSL